MTKALYLRPTSLVQGTGFAIIPLPEDDSDLMACVIEHKGSSLRLYYSMPYEQVVELIVSLFDLLDEETVHAVLSKLGVKL